MTENKLTEHEIVKICYDNLDKFVEIYDNEGREVNKMPPNEPLTVFCKSNSNEGFLIDLRRDELGLEALIAEKWIKHSELEKLARRNLALPIED